MGNGPVAQLVEQLTLNQWVQGSSPCGTTKTSAKAGVFVISQGPASVRCMKPHGGSCTCPVNIPMSIPGDIHHIVSQASVYLCSINMRLRRSIAILLLGIFFSNTMEAHQLLKLPALFEHLSEHQADGPMNWMEFISEHYIQGGDHADRDHHHHDLPFHCDNHCATQSIQARLPDTTPVGLTILNALELGLIAMVDRMPGRNGPSDVWQPPKRA